MPTRKPSSKPKAAAPSPTARPANRPPHEPTKVDRDTVSVMAAGGIAQADIARARGISEPTLRKHYRAELSAGMTALNTMVILAHIERIKAGDFQAIKWWEQSGWAGRNASSLTTASRPIPRCVSLWNSLARPPRRALSNRRRARDSRLSGNLREPCS